MIMAVPSCDDETDAAFKLFTRLYPNIAEIRSQDQGPGEGDIVFANKEKATKNPATFGAFYRWWKREQKRIHSQVVFDIMALIKGQSKQRVDDDLPAFLGGKTRPTLA